MTKLDRTKQIWSVEVSDSDVTKGVDYASKSLPWTFNRMGVVGPWTWYYRIMKIVVGVTVQELLLKLLRAQGMRIAKEWKDYRKEDTFDLRSRKGNKIDVKSLNHFVEFDGDIRPHFTLDYLIDNKGYSGARWKRFFPCLVPNDQLNREDVFVFAILSSRNYNSLRMGERGKNFVISSPSEGWMNFLNNKKMTLARENEEKGLDLSISMEQFTSLDQELPQFLIGYEKQGKFFEEPMKLSDTRDFELENVSALSYIRAARETDAYFAGTLSVAIKNHLKVPVLSGAKKANLNVQPGKAWKVNSEMFADLYLPRPLDLYYLGWISVDEFRETRKDYPSYAYPDDKKNDQENQEGRTTEGGVLFTHTCCYIYPNTFGGGLKNQNYYVLPKDLNIMNEFTA